LLGHGWQGFGKGTASAVLRVEYGRRLEQLTAES
jgi:hypothetical protein